MDDPQYGVDYMELVINLYFVGQGLFIETNLR